jgi:phosphocarrier protein
MEGVNGMRKTIILLMLAFSVFLVCACNVVKSPDFYSLDENDLVSSFTKVVGSRKVNAKSLLGVLSLGVVKGMTVNLIADGPDEDEALAGLAELIDSCFGE